MSQNFKDVRKTHGKWEISGEKIVPGKFIVSILWPYQDVVAF